jgi:hypothetical protein
VPKSEFSLLSSLLTGKCAQRRVRSRLHPPPHSLLSFINKFTSLHKASFWALFGLLCFSKSLFGEWKGRSTVFMSLPLSGGEMAMFLAEHGQVLATPSKGCYDHSCLEFGERAQRSVDMPAGGSWGVGGKACQSRCQPPDLFGISELLHLPMQKVEISRNLICIEGFPHRSMFCGQSCGQNQQGAQFYSS